MSDKLYQCSAAGRCEELMCNHKNKHDKNRCCDDKCGMLKKKGDNPACLPVPAALCGTCAGVKSCIKEKPVHKCDYYFKNKEEKMEKLLTLVEVCELIGKKEPVQARVHDVWEDLKGDFSELHLYRTVSYRRMPTKTTAPWTFDTAPRRGWLRYKEEKTATERIVTITPKGCNGLNFTTMLDKKEYSPNGVDGWRACGVEVEG